MTSLGQSQCPRRSLPDRLRDRTPFMFSNPARRARSVPSLRHATELHRSWPVVVIAAFAVRSGKILVRSRPSSWLHALSCRECIQMNAIADCCGCDWIHKVASVWTGLPFTLVMTSPDCNPAFSAGLPVSTRCSTIVGRAQLFQKIGLLPGSP